jgi:hypothetical protein
MKKYKCIKIKGLTLNKIEGLKYEVNYATELRIHTIISGFIFIPMYPLFW